VCSVGGGGRSTSAVLRLRRPAGVAMMQATDFWNWDDHARPGGSLGRPSGASLSSER